MNAVILGADVEALAAAAALRAGGMKVTIVAGLNAVPAFLMPPQDGAAPAPSVRSDVWATTMLVDGARLDFTSDVASTAAAIRAVSAHDAEQWPRFCAQMHAIAAVLEHLYRAPPVDPLTHEMSGFAALARAALRLRKLGPRDIRELLRILPMSAADLLNAWFESDAVKGVLGAIAVSHLAQGPRSGGTAFNLLHHHVGCAQGVFRRARGAAAPDAASVRRIEAEPLRIDIEGGRVAGVVVENGDTIPADVVVSALDPKRTLLELLDAGCLDPELVRSVRNVRSRGVTAFAVFTVTVAPDFSTLVIAPSLDYIERAHDCSKYGRLSDDPVIVAAYDGFDRVVAEVQYVPYALREGSWDDAAKKSLVQSVARRISEVSPAFGGRVSASVLTPFDLEAYYDWPQGQMNHAEIALDQVLWMRPVAALARYRTPVRGLYLCGPAMHPGGGLPGAAGANAASVILGDLKRR